MSNLGFRGVTSVGFRVSRVCVSQKLWRAFSFGPCVFGSQCGSNAEISSHVSGGPRPCKSGIVGGKKGP